MSFCNFKKSVTITLPSPLARLFHFLLSIFTYVLNLILLVFVVPTVIVKFAILYWFIGEDAMGVSHWLLFNVSLKDGPRRGKCKMHLKLSLESSSSSSEAVSVGGPLSLAIAIIFSATIWMIHAGGGFK